MHDHDNPFWHDGNSGPSEFLLHLHGITDYDCGVRGDQAIHAALRSCLGTVAAQPNSDLARLLGGPSTDTTWVVHHLGGYSGNISLSAEPHNWPQTLPGMAAGH